MPPKTLKRVVTKPSSKVILSSILQYENLGQLTVPDVLSLGSDGKLYLTRSREEPSARTKPQPITLKESVAWFRVGHQCFLNVTKGDHFDDWLKMVEQALS